MTMEFGIFDSFDLGRTNHHDLLADRLRFAEEAERCGFARYHVTEHHGTPLSMCPSPNIFLAAASQRTTRMRLGALVNVLPEHDPFRLAEEIATLDQLTGGRLDMGVGSGVSPYELGIFGVDPAKAKPIYREALGAITGALSTGRMRHDGQLIRSYDAALSVRPVQRPYPPLWYASSNADTAEWAGSQAINFVGRWHHGAMVDIARAYWDAWEKHRHDADRLNPHGGLPRVGMAVTMVIAPTDAQAHELFARSNELFCERITHLWHANNDHRADRMFATDTMLASGGAVVGSAETVRDQLVTRVEAALINHLTLSVYFGDMLLDEAAHSLRSFADTVAPALTAAADKNFELD